MTLTRHEKRGGRYGTSVYFTHRGQVVGICENELRANAFESGFNTRLEGGVRQQNPYSSRNKLYANWRRGFNKAAELLEADRRAGPEGAVLPKTPVRCRLVQDAAPTGGLNP